MLPDRRSTSGGAPHFLPGERGARFPVLPAWALSLGASLPLALLAFLLLAFFGCPSALWGHTEAAEPFSSSNPGSLSNSFGTAALLGAGDVGHNTQLAGQQPWAPEGTNRTPNVSADARAAGEGGPRSLLEEYVAFPGADTCGAWHREYTALHTRIRSEWAGKAGGKGRGKYMTWTCQPRRDCTGFGDRIIGIVSTFVAAMLTGRAFILADPVLERAFEPGEVDWRPGEDVPMQGTREQKLWPHITTPVGDLEEGAVLVLHAMNSGVVNGSAVHFPPNTLHFFAALAPASNILVHTNGGVLTRIYQHDSPSRRALLAMGLRLPVAHGCILRFLLRPRPEVLELLEQSPELALVQDQRRSVVGVQVRTSDSDPWDKAREPAQGGGGGGAGAVDKGAEEGAKEELEKVLEGAGVMLECADKVGQYWAPPGQHPPLWLLMSNSLGLKQALQQRHKTRIVITRIVPRHTLKGGASGIQETVAEWLLFSLCRVFVMSESSFSKSAYAYSMRSPPGFLFSRMEKVAQAHGECDPARPLDLFAFQHWSSL